MPAELPETILQFGTGRFLRAFFDLFVQNANDNGQNVGCIVAVQSTPGQRAEGLSSQGNGYHVAVRGLENEQVIDRVEKIQSISRALLANSQWQEVLEVAASPDLRLIISNTTEAGYALNEQDAPHDRPPQSFPAKLTLALWYRFQKGKPPVTLLPCELIEKNADKLRDLVVHQARKWSLPAEFCTWVASQCIWLNNLVDRIVVGPMPDHPLYGKDPMLLTTEPYALLAIDGSTGSSPAIFSHPNIEVVKDLAPYYLRKVRILNGIHSALVGKFMPQGFTTVQGALRDAKVKDWVLGLLYEEILPVIAYRVEDVARFARQTLDRFQNPFFEHKLADIAVKHREKRQIRLQSTSEEYQKLFGKKPRRILEALAFDPPV